MKTNHLRALGLSVGVGVLLYVVLIAGSDPQATLAAMRRLGASWWLAILGLSLCNYALRFARWHGYIRWLGDTINIGHHLVVYIAGFALTTTPGKAGESLRAYYLARRGVAYSHSLAALLAERVVDLAAIGLLALLVVVAFSGYVAWVSVPLVGLATGLFIVRRRRWLDAASRRVGEPETRVQRLLYALITAWHKIFALLAPWPLYAGLAVGLVAWAAEGVAVALIADALGAPLGLATAIGIYAAAILVGALSFIPGGLGSTEATMAVLLKLTGLDAGTALTVTLIARIATLWFAVTLGIVALAALETDRFWKTRHG